MAKDNSDTIAAMRLFSGFLEHHLSVGTGNKGVAWKAGQFAECAGVSASRVSEWRHGKSGLPTASLGLIEQAFFPEANARRPTNPAYLEWKRVREAIQHRGVPASTDAEARRHSQRDTWNVIMRSLAGRTFSIVRSGPSERAADHLRAESIDARLRERSFILTAPDWFREAIAADEQWRERYDLHPPTDLIGNVKCGEFLASIPVTGFAEIVAYHTDAYARDVLASLQRGPAYPPYNKKKLGLMGYRQPQHASKDEGVYLDLDFYVTDYFTHRVMRRVLHDLRNNHPALFREDADPYGAMPYLRYFTTSFGINILVTTNDPQGRRFYMTRLSERQGNANQHGRWHISANEGLNLEDVQTGRVGIDAAVARALSEELGVRIGQTPHETQYLEFAIDQRNLEPFISCVTHLDIPRHALYHDKELFARDDRREFSDVKDFPFTEQAIIDLLLNDPAGVEGFTSYALHILDSVLARRMVR